MRAGRRRSIFIGAGVGALVGIAASIGIGVSMKSGEPAVRTVITTVTAPVSADGSVPVVPGPATGAATPSSGATPTRSSNAADAIKPRIVWKPIAFGADRRREMVEYSRKHYGAKWADWRLVDPKVIVEHYTASDSFSSAWNTFESNSPDGELGQLPGTCSHFIIAKDGTIYQLDTLDTRCRHTVGLNHRSIGIEMVGMSDTGILSNPPQIKSALALTRWLQARFGISTRNVIGHSESVSSPYHLELYGPWKTQTHGDWSSSAMKVFRSRLAGG